MGTRAVVPAVLLFFLAGILPARPKIDVVVMANGDRFTCEIKKLESGVLYAGFDYVDGTVSLQWSKVARIESGQLFIVHTQDGSIYEGTIRTPETPGRQPVRIEVVEPAGNAPPLERAKVVEMAQTSDVFWKRFSGSLDSGVIFSRGNSNTQYNLGADLRIRGEDWRIAADFTSGLSKSEGVTASTRNQTRIWARKLIGGKRRWYYTGGSEFLQSSEQGIDLQTTIGAGLGRFLKDTNFVRASVTAGLAVQKTSYVPTAGTQSPPNDLAAMVAADLHMFRFKKTSFDITATALPVLTEAGRLRAYVNSAYSIQIVSNLWFKFSFYGSWDNRPPGHLSGSDYGVSSGISYSFN